MAEEHFGIGSEPHGAREFPKMVRQAHRADAPEYFYTIKEKADPELRPIGPTDRALGEYATAPDYRGAGVLGRSRKRPDHPKHLFAPYKGTNSREAPANLKPVGTGPYRFVDFEPGDLVKGERNPAYPLKVSTPRAASRSYPAWRSSILPPLPRRTITALLSPM